MAPSSAGEGFLIVGRVARAHGIRGEIVVEPLTDDPDSVFSPGRRVLLGDADGRAVATSNRRGAANARSELNLTATRPLGERLLLSTREITDRTDAELLNGVYLLLPDSEVVKPAEGEAYLHELTGMRVRYAEAGNAEARRERSGAEAGDAEAGHAEARRGRSGAEAGNAAERSGAEKVRDIGVVSAIFELPQGLMLEIRRDDGSMVLFPFRDDAVVRIDREARVLHVVDPAGLLDL